MKAKTLLLRRLVAGAACAALVTAAAQAAPAPSDHDSAVKALSDIDLAVKAITGAEQNASNGPSRYRLAAHQAINDLVGQDDPAYDVAAPGNEDPLGAIGQLNHLLDRTQTPPFVPLLDGVLVNLQSSVASLQDALKSHGLDDYQDNVSQALLTLEMAVGRSDSFDAFGGMRGALANTVLGVPDNAQTQTGLASPHLVGYGVWHGWLLWHAVALNSGAVDVSGSSILEKKGSMLVLYAPAAALIYHLHTADSGTSMMSSAPAKSRIVNVADKNGDGGVSYTVAQAANGATVYAAHCASCHGADLQGVAAPAVAGKDFLTTAHKNGYSVAILDTIVTQNMPFNDPGSLSPSEYADVMAYLLAANCYPSGSAAFPANPGSGFGKAVLSMPGEPAQKPNAKGVCSVTAKS